MKRILSSSISSTSKQPLIKGSLDFLQDSYKEVIGAIMKGLVTYTTNDVLKIHGCDVTGSGTYAVTAGAIYYNGEVYLVDAATGLTPGGGQTVVWSIVTTFDAIDPITFSDLSTHSVHQISKIALVVGASGSGIADYNASIVKGYDSGEIAPVYQTGWSASGSFPFKYEKIGKVVFLSGRVLRGSGGTNLILQLPNGYRPKTDTQLFVFAIDAASAPVQRQISIDTGDGDVRDQGGAVNTEIYTFDNISYVAL